MENINKQKDSIVIIGISIIILSISISILSLRTKYDIARLQKYDTCLTEAITAIPYPNETEQRSDLLKNCMDN